MFGELLDLLRAEPALHIAVWTFVGLMVGSFLNVVAYRLPKVMERDWHRQCAELRGETPEAEAEPFDLVRPRSRCPECGHGIRWYENVPVVSWLVLRGRCSSCGWRIPVRYPLVEGQGNFDLLFRVHGSQGTAAVRLVRRHCWMQ